jgi:hypothetical protein
VTAGKPSTRLLVEGVVIVVSILLAFGIEAAWEERGERRSERLALQALHAEALANGELLTSVVQRVRDDVGRVEAFYDTPLAELESVPLEVTSSQVVQSLWRPNTYALKDGALEGLVRAGRLELIQSTELRQRLVDWQGEAADLDERHEVLASLEREIMVAIGRLEVAQPWMATRGLPTQSGVADPSRGLDRFPTNLRPIREDPSVMGPVAAMQFQRQVYLMTLSQLQESLNGLIDELAAELR